MSKHEAQIIRTIATSDNVDWFFIRVDNVPMGLRSSGVWPHNAAGPTLRLRFSNPLVKDHEDYQEIRRLVLEEIVRVQGQ